MKYFIFVFILLLLPFGGASAKDPSSPCIPDSPYTPDMQNCVMQSYEKSDAELNRVYKELITVAKKVSKEKETRDAQRKWLKWVQSECNNSSAVFAGGSMEDITRYSCLEQENTKRTQMLHDSIDSLKMEIIN